MERVLTQSLTPVSGAIDYVVVPLPAAAKSWAITIFPIGAGSEDAPSVDIQYECGNAYYKRSLASDGSGGSITALVNRATVITGSDNPNKVRLKITHGSTPTPSLTVQADFAR